MVIFVAVFKQEAQRATYRAPEYNVPPFWQINQDGNFCLLISLKKLEPQGALIAHLSTMSTSVIS